MKAKKWISAFLAAVTAVTMLFAGSVTAGAEDSSRVITVSDTGSPYSVQYYPSLVYEGMKGTQEALMINGITKEEYRWLKERAENSRVSVSVIFEGDVYFCVTINESQMYSNMGLKSDVAKAADFIQNGSGYSFVIILNKDIVSDSARKLLKSGIKTCFMFISAVNSDGEECGYYDQYAFYSDFSVAEDSSAAKSAKTSTASAPTKKMKLCTVSIAKIEGASDFWSIGDGYYSVENSADPNIHPDTDQIVYIGEDELKSWQKTGKISYKKVKTDVKMTDMLRSGSFTADGSYIQLITCDKDHNILKRYIVSHNEKNTKITTAYTKGSDWSYTNPDGYTVESSWNKARTTLTITVTAPDGKKKSTKLTYTGGEDGWYYTIASAGTGKYVAYVLWQTDAAALDNIYREYDVYGIKKNGKLTRLYRSSENPSIGNDGHVFSIFALSTNENYFAWGDWYIATISRVYFSDSGETVFFTLDGLEKSGGSALWNYYLDGFVGKAYGKRMIMTIKESRQDNPDPEYILADVGTKTILSDIYRTMSTLDGKIYLVQNKKGKWGYIDKKGNELAFFDDAGEFIGDYAPVVKNGKAYLIDRNMNQVSEKIDADSVRTFSEGLYKIQKGNKTMLMTYKK